MDGNREVCAVLLAGGRGTRLKPITDSVPKPLIEISGKPFIDRLLSQISKMGLKRCVLLIGYKSDMIKEHCKNGSEWKLKMDYSVEDANFPLGTGGALVNAAPLLSPTALVVNGDTWVEYNLDEFLAFHRMKKALISIHSLFGPLEGRGKIDIGKDGKVEHFGEKQGNGNGAFNTGVYLVEKEALLLLAKEVESGRLPKSFSLEKDGFPLIMKKNGLYAHIGEGKFLDIGTFASLAGAHNIIR